MRWTPHKLLEIPTDEEISCLEPDELIELHRVREEAIQNESKDKYRYGFKFENWRKLEEQLATHSEAFVSGGNRCLAPDQLIYDPVADKETPVSEIAGDFHVYAWDGTKKVVAPAEKPFRKPRAQIYRVNLDNGEHLDCSAAHLVLTVDGWQPVSRLWIGHELVGADSDIPVKVKDIHSLQEEWVWDFTVPTYHNYVAAGVISHNSSKTQVGAYFVVKAALENPRSTIYCFSQNAAVSVRQQQAAVYDWLPAEFKAKQTSSSTYISYSEANGFTESRFILPNGSKIFFMTYSAFLNNPTILEGAELGSHDPKWLNIGAHCDEYLGDPKLIDTLRFRLATRNAKLLLTFTPIFGYTETVNQYLKGAKVIESRPAELIGGEPLPTVMECQNINGTVHYFWSEDNPFGGYDRIKETLKGKPKSEILIRAYGIPTKSATTRFPRFNAAVNVVTPDKIPTENVTRYQIIDPAGSKSWFMAWIAVDMSGTFWVYREWPGVDVGDWAEWKSGKWVPGEGAKGQGYGIRDYVDLMRDMEAGEEIFERIIDPRLGAAKYQAQDGSSSIIEDLSDNGIVCVPAPGLEIDDGLQALISKMSWDTAKPMDSVNRPHFYISDECQNIIRGLAEYTGQEGLKEAWKDVIDVLRYAAISDIDHCDSKSIMVTCPAGRGY